MTTHYDRSGPSGHAEAGLSQRLGDGDQRQSDDGRRIARIHRAQQRGPGRLGPEAARAVNRPVPLDVAPDFRVGEIPEKHLRFDDRCLPEFVRDAAQRERAQEDDPLAAERRELPPGPVRRARFADDPPGMNGHLVGPDHDRLRIPARNGQGFFVGEARGQRIRGLVPARGLVDFGGDDVKRYAQPIQQQAPVRTGGSEDQGFLV